MFSIGAVVRRGPSVFVAVVVSVFGFSAVGLEDARAQNTAGVPSPVVNEEHRSAQYRAAFDPDTDNFAQRLHYQEAFNGDLMWRAVLQVRETTDSVVDFDYVRGELFWQIETKSDFWKTGFRFDIQYTAENRPGFVAVNWLNQFQLAPKLSARVALITRRQIAQNRNDGVFLQSRSNLAYAASPDVTVGVESYNTYGFTENIPALDKQNHVVGPFATYRPAKNWSISGGALFGVTDVSPDVNIRLWLTRNF